ATCTVVSPGIVEDIVAPIPLTDNRCCWPVRMNSKAVPDVGNQPAVRLKFQQQRASIARRARPADMLDMHHGIATKDGTDGISRSQVGPTRRLEIELALAPSERNPSRRAIGIGDMLRWNPAVQLMPDSRGGQDQIHMRAVAPHEDKNALLRLFPVRIARHNGASQCSQQIEAGYRQKHEPRSLQDAL